MKKILSFLLAMIMIVSLTACQSGENSSSQQSDEVVSNDQSSSSGETTPLNVSLIAPFTGNNAQHGIAMQRGIEIAFEEYNANGGYEGREVQLLTFDDKNDAKEAVNVAQLAANTEGLLCNFGPWSSTCAIAVAPIFEKVKVAVYATSSSHEDFTQVNEYCIRGSNTQVIQQKWAADLVMNTMHYDKAAFIHAQDDASQGAAENFKKFFEELGGTVTSINPYIIGNRDFTAMLTKIKNEGVSCVATMGSYSDIATMIMQAHQVDFYPTFTLNGSSFQPELIDILKDDDGLADIVILTAFDPEHPDPAAQEFIQKFAEEYDGAQVTSHAYNAYDGALHFLQALDEVGPDSDAIAKYMRNNPSAPGLLGSYPFVDGDPEKPLFSVGIRDGKFFSWTADDFVSRA